MIKSRGPVLLIILVMAAGAYAGAFATARLSLERQPDLPSGPAADHLATTAFPGLRVWGGGNAETIEPFGDGEGVKYGSVSYWVKHTEATRDVATYTAGARDRLAADGWRIHDFRVAAPEPLVDGGVEHSAAFWATRPGLVLSFTDHYWTERPAYDSTGAAAAELWRAPPSWLPAASWGGAIGGALIALLLTLWVRRRTASVPHAGRAAGTAAAVALFLLLPTLLGPAGEQPMDSPWFGGFYGMGRGGAIVAAGIAVLILLVAAALGRTGRALLGLVSRRPRTVATVLAAAVLAAVLPGVLRDIAAGDPPCGASGLPAEPPIEQVRDSRHVKIFVSNTTTEQERALIDAAIFRSHAGSLGELVWQPHSEKFRDTYCGGGDVPQAAVASLPYFFDVTLSNVATLPALAEEVTGLAGVLAVQRARG